jgi:ribonuclease BN (tRNA processing enzyme)
VLIHDAQHTAEEYEPKRHWGHCTVGYALHVAREAGVRTLALFHHDPLHGDDDMDRIANNASELGYQHEGKPLLFYRGGYGRYEI